MAVETAQAHTSMRDKSPDDIRTADVKDIAHVLEHYFEEHGKYPITQNNDHGENWTSLISQLAKNTNTSDHVPQDPCHIQNSEYTYVYKSSEQGDAYVLGALLSDTDYRYVGDHHEDADGTILGIWCGEGKFDREYCVVSTETSHAH